ncbi:sensor histidine kinase KdpD [Cellulomonas sp. KRMCY2]|uniref:sensor histidine kinase n=1 Tax=Cellulomonas sp. KRMCY2 TaxID=1304865 RepID=UPI0012DDB193|nr:HAMP domain-containing sensor histidine kinase [Cellulomonas sp. KRMCY2]
MSATTSPAAEGSGGGLALFWAWLAFAAACTAVMWVRPGEETVAYHLAWASFALLYGIGNWRLRVAVVGVALCTVATGAVLVVRAASGVLPWQETTEIPLMSLLIFLVVWHVRLRQVALGTVITMAERERQLANDRDRLTRLTSHELRTPLTIARGYVELLLRRPHEPEERRDLAVVEDELDRLGRVTDRLMRAIRLQGGTDIEWVDLDALLTQTVERWMQVAERDWVLDARGGSYAGSAERMRATLDTLIENALRYTTVGDSIRLTASRGAGLVEVTVADSGSGLSADQVAAINDMAGASAPPRDELSQTGLGLALVRGLAQARGGRLLAAIPPGGGALLIVQIPVDPPATTTPADLPAAPDDAVRNDRDAEAVLDRRLRFEPARRRIRAASLGRPVPDVLHAGADDS